MFCVPKLLGIDIQSQRIRAVSVRAGKPIASFARDLPTPVLTDDKIVNPNVLKEALSDLVHQHRLRKYQAVISLSSAHVHHETLRLPAGLTQAAIDEAVQKHIQQTMSWIKESLCMDFYIDKTEDIYWDAHIFVARQSYVESFKEVIAASSLKLRAIDIDVYAVNRLMVNLMGNAFAKKEYGILYANENGIWLIAKKPWLISTVKYWEKADENWLDELHVQLHEALKLLTPHQSIPLFLCMPEDLSMRITQAFLQPYPFVKYQAKLPVSVGFELAFSLGLYGSVKWK